MPLRHYVLKATLHDVKMICRHQLFLAQTIHGFNHPAVSAALFEVKNTFRAFDQVETWMQPLDTDMLRLIELMVALDGVQVHDLDRFCAVVYALTNFLQDELLTHLNTPTATTPIADTVDAPESAADTLAEVEEPIEETDTETTDEGGASPVVLTTEDPVADTTPPASDPVTNDDTTPSVDADGSAPDDEHAEPPTTTVLPTDVNLKVMHQLLQNQRIIRNKERAFGRKGQRLSQHADYQDAKRSCRAALHIYRGQLERNEVEARATDVIIFEELGHALQLVQLVPLFVQVMRKYSVVIDSKTNHLIA